MLAQNIPKLRPKGYLSTEVQLCLLCFFTSVFPSVLSICPSFISSLFIPQVRAQSWEQTAAHRGTVLDGKQTPTGWGLHLKTSAECLSLTARLVMPKGQEEPGWHPEIQAGSVAGAQKCSVPHVHCKDRALHRIAPWHGHCCLHGDLYRSECQTAAQMLRVCNCQGLASGWARPRSTSHKRTGSYQCGWSSGLRFLWVKQFLLIPKIKWHSSRPRQNASQKTCTQ